MAHNSSSAASPLLPRSTQGRARRQSRRRCILWTAAGFIFACALVVMVSFRSSPQNNLSESHAFNFLVIGDWGREGLYNQSEIATQMGKVGDYLGIEFVISVGDNFYETGLTGYDDPAFTASFTDVYTAQSLQTTWYTILGNHDYMGDVLAQLSDEIVRRDRRWFCKREFNLQHSLCDVSGSDCSASVDMFLIDTTPFINEYWENTSQTFDWRGLAPKDDQIEYQLKNLERNLRDSKATWKIVLGHHTIRSVGHHGSLQELIDNVLPILEKYKVDLYINGHDHNVQHIKQSDSPVHFFTSGGGSKAYNGLQPYTDEDGVQFVFDGQGFLSVSMLSNSISLKFYNVFGDVLYSYALKK